MRSFYICVLAIFLLCNCSSRIPEPISYPYSQQKKMQAASHWDVLALDLAGRINKQLIQTNNHDKAIFVKQTCGDENSPCQANATSTFNEAFHDLLITSLFGYGVPTKSRADQEAIEVCYKVQIVYHNTDRVRTLQPGLLTALSAAVVVLHNAPAELIILAAGVGADIANTSMVASSHYEVIITTSIITDNQYLFRASDIYYINEKDFFQYQENMPQTKTIKLSDQKKPGQPDNLAQRPANTTALAKSATGTKSVSEATL